MIRRIEVGPGWTRYKSDEPVQPGTYYTTHARLNTDRLKRGLSCLAVQDPDGQFRWLLPFERWIKRAVEGFEPPEFALYGQGLAETGGLPLRTWQRAVLHDMMVSLDVAGFYRRGVVAPLGAGKTLAGLCMAAKFERPIVAAPLHLHGSWRAEAEKWGMACPLTTSYESLHKHEGGDCYVFDEVLALKNPTTARHTKALRVAAAAKCVVGFTGTPSSVSPTDLRWLRAVYPGSVPESDVAWRFLWGLDTELVEVAPERRAYVTKTWDTKAISTFVAPFMGVVPRDEIVAELPEVSYEVIKVAKPKRFDLVRRGAATEAGRAKAFAQALQISDGFFYNDLGQPVETGTDKLDALEEIINSLDEPIVVFAAWDSSVSAIAGRFGDYRPAIIRGGSDYDSALAQFVDGGTSLLIANASIATGMNLQRARVMVFFSNSTSPVNRTQAEGRIVRPGQKARGVVIYDLVAEGTLDEARLRLLQAHREESEGFVLAALRREFEREVKP